MSDPKNEETPEKTSASPAVERPDEDTENETVASDEPDARAAGESEEPASAAAPADADESSEVTAEDKTDRIGTDETVALPVVEPKSSPISSPEAAPAPTSPPAPAPTSPPEVDATDAPTVQIPVRNHAPKAPPQRIPPRTEQPPAQPEPARVAVQPTPTRIPPTRDKGRGRRLVVIGATALVVVALIVAGVLVFLQDRANNSPESRIRTSIDTFVGALTAGDLATLRESTCGGLSDFYASVEPEAFRDIHRLAVEQGEIPVVTSVDRIQITDSTAIAQVTAHTANNPADVTDRTFDLALDGEQWKVCSE